jgi:hypothetical protein
MGARVKYAKVLVRPQPRGFIGLVWEPIWEGARKCTSRHETAPQKTWDEAAIIARSWARTHGFTVLYTKFEAGLRGPALVGDDTYEGE